MDNVKYFIDLFESIPDYKRIVLIMFLIKNDVNFLYECGFLKRDITFLYNEFKKNLLEVNEDYLDHIKNQEDSIIERILNKKMEEYFTTMFEDLRHERSLILLLSLTDPDILKQSKFTVDEIFIIKSLALEKLHRRRILKKYHAVSLLE